MGQTPSANKEPARDSMRSLADIEEGTRLVRTFVGIRSPERRRMALEYVADLAKTDDAETHHPALLNGTEDQGNDVRGVCDEDAVERA